MPAEVDATTAVAVPPALAGREHELARLSRAFARAQQGETLVTLLAGEPGIGKSRILQEFAAGATQAGGLALRGGASGAEGMPPYLPFLEALGAYIRSVPATRLRVQAAVGAAALVSVFPEIAARFDEPLPAFPLPPEQARLRLYEAVGDLLAAIGAEQPVALILDDLQWADSASLGLLCYLAARRAGARLTIAGAYREGETAANPAFARALVELNRLRALETIAVGPLASDAMAALAGEQLGAAIDASLARRLVEHSEGNPFFAEELLRGWREAGAVAERGGCWTATGPLDAALPATIVAAVRQRLERLPCETVELLRTAALIGRSFDSGLLAAAAGQPAEPVEEQLRPAVEARLLHAGAGGGFRFGHDKIRECLYADITPARRTRLHGFIGRALEQRGRPENAQRLAELAFHYARSGDRTRGADYARRAAEQAMAAYAPAEALHHHRTALALLDPGDARHGALQLGRAQAALLAGEEHEAVEAYGAAEAWFERAGDQERAARAAHGIGQAWWRLESIPAARAAFERALARLAGAPGPLLIELLVDLGSLLVVSLHAQAEGLAHIERAWALARELRDERAEAAAARAAGTAQWRVNRLDAAAHTLARAVALAAGQDDPLQAAEACAILAQVYVMSCRLQPLDALVPQWLEFARRCHDPYQLRHVHSMLAILYAFRGRLREADEQLALARPIVTRLTSPEPRGTLHMAAGTRALYSGDYAGAEAEYAAAVEHFRTIGPDALIWYLGLLGVAQAHQRKRAEALACMEEVAGLLASYPRGTVPTAEPLAHLAAMAALLGDAAWARRVYPDLLAFRGQSHDALVDRLLGQLAGLLGDRPAAEIHLAAAEATARDQALRPELAQTLVALAELGLAAGGRGSAAHARERLAEAARLFDEVGNATEAARARARLARLGRPAPRARAALPAGLSAREAEVLHLVAAGLSNRQIAAALHLSVRTVANHLASILNKTGCDNRAAAVAFAMRHGLVE